MSTLSSLIDELNKSADEWNKSNMFELARMCSDAADTIWQLRDDLQRANDAVRDAEHDESRAWDRVRKVEAENEKLREELDCCLRLAPNCDVCEAMLDCWECLRADSSQKERKRLDYENGQLRELVRDMWNGMCGYAHDCRSCEHYELHEGQRLVGECQYHARMNELGVEV